MASTREATSARRTHRPEDMLADDNMMLAPFHLPLPPLASPRLVQYEAAVKLQSIARMKICAASTRRRLAAWAKIDELRRRHATEAIPGDVFCTDEMLVAREALRTHPLVAEAIEQAWATCQEITQQQGVLDQQNFNSMTRRIYLVTVLNSAREPSVTECNRARARDWANDCGNTNGMTFDQFADSWFELADLHTLTIGPAEYARWVRDTTRRIVKRDDKRVVWRGCDAIATADRHSGTHKDPKRRSGSPGNQGKQRQRSRTPSRKRGSNAGWSWQMTHWLAAFRSEEDDELSRGTTDMPHRRTFSEKVRLSRGSRDDGKRSKGRLSHGKAAQGQSAARLTSEQSASGSARSEPSLEAPAANKSASRPRHTTAAASEAAANQPTPPRPSEAASYLSAGRASSRSRPRLLPAVSDRPPILPPAHPHTLSPLGTSTSQTQMSRGSGKLPSGRLPKLPPMLTRRASDIVNEALPAQLSRRSSAEKLKLTSEIAKDAKPALLSRRSSEKLTDAVLALLSSRSSEVLVPALLSHRSSEKLTEAKEAVAGSWRSMGAGTLDSLLL